jgi:hypothetical protein
MQQSTSQQHFRLGHGTWVLGILCMALIAALLNRQAEVSTVATTPDLVLIAARATVQVLIASCTALAAPLLVGWMIWRLRGRPRHGGQIAFGVTALVALLAAFSLSIMEARSRMIYTNIESAQRQILGAIGTTMSDGVLSQETIPSAVEDIMAVMPLRTRAAGGDALEEVMAAHLRNTAAATLTYIVALRALADCNMRGLEQQGEIERRRATIRNFIRANAAYGRAFDATPTALATGLRDITGHAAYKASLQRAAERRVVAQRPYLRDLLAMRESIARHMDEVFALLAGARTAWRQDPSGEFFFSDDDVRARFQDSIVELEKAKIRLAAAEDR